MPSDGKGPYIVNGRLDTTIDCPDERAGFSERERLPVVPLTDARVESGWAVLDRGRP